MEREKNLYEKKNKFNSKMYLSFIWEEIFISANNF